MGVALLWMARAAGVAALLYLLALAALWALQERLLFIGWDGLTDGEVAMVPGLAEVEVPGPDGPLRGWWRPPDAGRETIVVFHGNGGFQWPKMIPWARRGHGVLLVAYRGYAGNAGAPSEAGLLDDARAALAFAAAQGVPETRTVLYGESLGTGVATRMAAEGDWRALVLDAPYTSIPDRAAEIYGIFPVRAMIRTRFETRAVLPEVEAPVLILHGTADRVIPVAHGRALLAVAGEPKDGVWVEGGTHFLPPEVVDRAMAGFLAATAG
ncbi:alpha/beta hydrolase [Jannaschia sp. Os4]|uniref:alpha/beta hydrolase n=1 Tax=Jannaschia sp. Os4 TaxID=2807617 RepID=UPI001939A34E|nr:alpha/beta hydrolase [Jannaschia sp. Os4]MBM2577580.1 alpha/beta hydrolase [Jannaschia sp. Os4]